MHSQTTAVKLTLAALAISGMFLASRAFAADIKGQVMGGGAPIAQSTVTLWAASADAPKQLAQTKTDNEGRFEVSTAGAPAHDASLYLTAAEAFLRETRRVATIRRSRCWPWWAASRRHAWSSTSSPPSHRLSPTHSSSMAPRSTAHQSSCALQRAMCPILWISKEATTARRFWMLSTARRHPRWPTSLHSPAWS